MFLIALFGIPAFIAAICIVVGLVRYYITDKDAVAFSDGLLASIWVAVICTVVLATFTVITSGNGASKINSIKSINQNLEVVREQKRGEIKYLNEALGPDQVELIADAITVDDTGAKVFFSNNSAVSSLVITKAEKVIAANAVIFEYEKKIRGEQTAICSNRNNPFIPIVPFLYPDCDLDWTLPAPEIDTEFYDGND